MSTSEAFKHYSPATRFLFRIIGPVMASVMGSRLRYRLNNPVRILEGAGLLPGQDVLEVGCGTGHFTIPAAGKIGDKGSLHAIDIYPSSIECVSKKLADRQITTVRLTNADAMDSGLPDASYDLILLFGVVPAPMISLKKLLPEMHRLLRPGGTLAIWPFLWLSHKSFTDDGLFSFSGRKNGVHNFRKIDAVAG